MAKKIPSFPKKRAFPGTAKHGINRTLYTQGCRCEDCKKLNTIYHRNYRKEKRLAYK